MAHNSIGGFFVNVAAEVDAQSFKKAEASINGLEKSVSKLLGFVKSSAPILMATTAGAVETASLKMSKAIGIGAAELDQWKTAVGIAGVNTAALTSSMAQLETKMQRLKIGEVDRGLAKNLGLLGINYGDFAKQDATGRMRSVFNQAGMMKDQQQAAQLVADTLGAGAREYYDWLKLSGRTLDQELAQSKALTFTTEQTKKQAAEFSAEVKAIGGAVKSIATLVGSDIAAQLIPATRSLKEIVAANHDLIVSGINGFINNVGSAFNAFLTIAGKIRPLLDRVISGFGGLDKILIKAGTGFTALKLANVATNLRGILGSVNLLKMGLKGLGLGALYLLVDDVMTYLNGGRSVTGLVIKGIEELKDKFKDLIPADMFSTLNEALENLKDITKKVWDNTAGFRDALKDLGAEFVKEAIDSVTKSIAGLSTALTWSMKLFNAFTEKGFTGGIDFIKESLFGEENAEERKKIKDWVSVPIEAAGYVMNPEKLLTKVVGEVVVNNIAKEANTTAEPEEKKIITEPGEKTDPEEKKKTGLKQRAENFFGQFKPGKKIEDGIIDPAGRVTQVAPDDWVFAARNLDDMAAAFVPQGVTNNNSSLNAPVNNVINQTITVNGGRDTAQAVKAQAYNGAAKALQQTITKGNRLLQQMPGTL